MVKVLAAWLRLAGTRRVRPPVQVSCQQARFPMQARHMRTRSVLRAVWARMPMWSLHGQGCRTLLKSKFFCLLGRRAQ